MTISAPSLSSPSTLVGLLWPSRDDARFAALRAIGPLVNAIYVKIQAALT